MNVTKNMVSNNLCKNAAIRQLFLSGPMSWDDMEREGGQALGNNADSSERYSFIGFEI